ncbi:MAG: rRNA adenine N(6)-methyltransferase family protein [Patescibacteria group bacterium]
MDNRIIYSQNFLINKSLISELVKKSSITNEDIVYEIGAGEGVITEELLKKAGKVVAFELDKNLFDKLTIKFQNEKSLNIIFGNFLDFNLPNFPYKVFSNIPFNITSEIIKKLTRTGNSPDEAYLVIQKEAAQKFVGKPYSRRNSLVAILLKPWFDLEIFYKFNQGDFYPRPSVETVLLKMTRRDKPVVDFKNKRSFEDFVTYIFNGNKPLIVKGVKPGDLDFESWIKIFNESSYKNLTSGSYAKMIRQQDKLEKNHRTRVDKNWRQKQIIKKDSGLGQNDRVAPCHVDKRG